MADPHLQPWILGLFLIHEMANRVRLLRIRSAKSIPKPTVDWKYTRRLGFSHAFYAPISGAHDHRITFGSVQFCTVLLDIATALQDRSIALLVRHRVWNCACSIE